MYRSMLKFIRVVLAFMVDCFVTIVFGVYGVPLFTSMVAGATGALNLENTFDKLIMWALPSLFVTGVLLGLCFVIYKQIWRSLGNILEQLARRHEEREALKDDEGAEKRRKFRKAAGRKQA